jgi:hypothetical protein
MNAFLSFTSPIELFDWEQRNSESYVLSVNEINFENCFPKRSSLHMDGVARQRVGSGWALVLREHQWTTNYVT